LKIKNQRKFMKMSDFWMIEADFTK